MIPEVVVVHNTPYQVLPEVLGKGVFSEIRKCEHKDSKEVMAGKFRHLIKDKWQQKLLEEKAIIELMPKHNRFIQVFHNDIENEEQMGDTIYLNTCMLMEYASHGNLLVYAFVHKLNFLQDQLHIFLQCALALRNLHDLNIAHLDIRPSHFLVCVERGNLFMKLTDFADAQMMGDEGTLESGVARDIHVAGACPFLAAEFFGGKRVTDCKPADIFSLAVTFLTIMAQDQQPPRVGGLELGRHIKYHDIIDLAPCVSERGQVAIEEEFTCLLASMLGVIPSSRPRARELVCSMYKICLNSKDRSLTSG